MSRERQKVCKNVVEDRISNLPSQVIDSILSKLPMRDIVRTSILSSKWRYKWTTVPSLVFDTNCCPPWCQREAIERSKALASIINRVLLFHTSSIQVLQLKDLHVVPDIDCWIFHVSRRSIKALVLEICGSQKYKLPSSLYTCESLVNLKLSTCVLRPPSSFKGFKSLKCLNLKDVTLTEDAFQNLISSCPLLERLTLLNSQELNLKINGSNLQCIDIDGAFKKITLGNTLHKLSEISIGMWNIVTEHCVDVQNYMTQFFVNIPGIQRLKVKCYFLRYLSIGLIRERLPAPCFDLYHLSIFLNFDDLDASMTALCLFRMSPNLKELEIEDGTPYESEPEESSMWVDESKWHCIFAKLQWVKIVDVSGTRGHLQFIKFVLLNSPVLEKMTIFPEYDDGFEQDFVERDFLKHMLRFRRASTRAEIILSPHWAPVT